MPIVVDDFQRLWERLYSPRFGGVWRGMRRKAFGINGILFNRRRLLTCFRYDCDLRSRFRGSVHHRTINEGRHSAPLCPLGINRNDVPQYPGAGTATGMHFSQVPTQFFCD